MSYKIKVLFLGIFMFFIFITLFTYFSIKQENIFNDNLIVMETKSKNYITYNLLPIVNEKVFTLEELYENKVLPKLYYNFNECNNKSYVVIKQKQNFYEMNTTLICGNKTETITSYFN